MKNLKQCYSEYKTKRKMKCTVILYFLFCLISFGGCGKNADTSTESAVENMPDSAETQPNTDSDTQYYLSECIRNSVKELDDTDDVHEAEYLVCTTTSFVPYDECVFTYTFVLDVNQKKLYNGVVDVTDFSMAKAVTDIDEDAIDAIMSVLDSMDLHNWNPDIMESCYGQMDSYHWNLYIILSKEKLRTVNFRGTVPGNEQEARFSAVYEMVNELCAIPDEYRYEYY